MKPKPQPALAKHGGMTSLASLSTISNHKQCTFILGAAFHSSDYQCHTSSCSRSLMSDHGRTQDDETTVTRALIRKSYEPQKSALSQEHGAEPRHLQIRKQRPDHTPMTFPQETFEQRSRNERASRQATHP
jgi:hypothetical protein